jgi:hypothetical protein
LGEVSATGSISVSEWAAEWQSLLLLAWQLPLASPWLWQ